MTGLSGWGTMVIQQREAGGDRKSEEYKKSVVASIPQPIEEMKPFESNQNDNKAASKAGKMFDQYLAP